MGKRAPYKDPCNHPSRGVWWQAGVLERVPAQPRRSDERYARHMAVPAQPRRAHRPAGRQNGLSSCLCRCYINKTTVKTISSLSFQPENSAQTAPKQPPNSRCFREVQVFGSMAAGSNDTVDQIQAMTRRSQPVSTQPASLTYRAQFF